MQAAMHNLVCEWHHLVIIHEIWYAHCTCIGIVSIVYKFFSVA